MPLFVFGEGQQSARDIADKQARRARELPEDLRKAMRLIGETALKTSDALLTAEIYRKPEDLSSTGRPKWRRTNRLAAGERLQFEDGGLTAVLVNEVEYAEPRHEANKPGRRQINPERTAHWRDDTIQALRAYVPGLIAETLRSGFGGAQFSTEPAGGQSGGDDGL